MSFKWEPGRNAIHGLIQLIDVLAIAFNRFRQLSFKLLHYRDERFQVERQRLQNQFSGITHAVFPRADIAPQHTAARIANRAVAELARGGSRDEAVVRQAQEWVTAVGWVLVPHDAPKEPLSELWRAFDEEGTLLDQYSPVRQRLLAALARIGQTVPDEIVRRDKLAFCSLMHEGEEPVPQDLLLEWVRETNMSTEPSVGLEALPQFSPAVAEILAQWQTETARFANDVRTHNAVFEAAREAFEAWARVAYFTGREAGSDATDEQVREYYVNLLMELGKTLRAIGLADRVQGLEAGKEAPRQVAVELLRYVVAGDRAAVAHLDGAMRDAAFVGGGAAAAYIKNELRYEVLNIRPPVPVPRNWEGHPPENEIRTTNDFVAWIDRQLDFLHFVSRSRDERNTGATVRNAHRLLTQLGITHSHPFPHGGMTDAEEEAHLRNLRNVCLTAEESEKGKQSEGAGAQQPIEAEKLAAPPRNPVIPHQPTVDFLAAADLATALGLSDKTNTVESALRRFAKDHPDCREEIEAPRKGEPRVLYRVADVWAFLLGKLPGWRDSSTTAV